MATIDIDVEDYLDEVPTKVLIAELESRRSDADREAKSLYEATMASDFRDWTRLADFIASGETADALDLLGRISPFGVSFATVKLALIRNPHIGGAA